MQPNNCYFCLATTYSLVCQLTIFSYFCRYINYLFYHFPTHRIMLFIMCLSSFSSNFLMVFSFSGYLFFIINSFLFCKSLELFLRKKFETAMKMKVQRYTVPKMKTNLRNKKSSILTRVA